MIFATFNSTLLVVLVGISLFAAFILAHMELKEFIKPWKFIAPIAFGLLVVSPLTMGKTPIFPQSNIPYYLEGFEFGLILTLRWFAFLTSSFAFIWATHPRDLVQSLAESGIPYTIAHALEIALATLPIIDYDAKVINYSHKIRQVGLGKNRLQATWEKVTKLVTTMLIRGIKHSQTLAIAMNSRGYGAYKERTYMNKLNKSNYAKVFRYLWLILTVVWVTYSILTYGYGYAGLIR